MGQIDIEQNHIAESIITDCRADFLTLWTFVKYNNECNFGLYMCTCTHRHSQHAGVPCTSYCIV